MSPNLQNTNNPLDQAENETQHKQKSSTASVSSSQSVEGQTTAHWNNCNGENNANQIVDHNSEQIESDANGDTKENGTLHQISNSI